jgi:hypothetical protein
MVDAIKLNELTKEMNLEKNVNIERSVNINELQPTN